MNKFFPCLSVALLLLSAICFTTCKKEFSYEGGGVIALPGGTAIYSFISAAGACSNSILEGNYYTAVALTADNTIQLRVDVDSIGTYVVNTNTANGIYFSGSGSFTDTGMQMITMSGSGKPAAEGSFKYNIPGNTGCYFNVEVIKAPIPQAAFTLIGAPNACQNIFMLGNFVAGT